MYDHLDDVDPPVPGPGDRSRIGARARQRRQRRTALVSSSGAVAAVVLGLVFLSLSGGAPTPDTQQLVTPAPVVITTAPTSVTPGPRLTTSPSAGPGTASSQPSGAVTRRPTSSTAPVPAACSPTAAAPCPDGRPGWTGTDACTVFTGAFGASSREVVPGLTASLDLPSSTGSTSFPATLTFRNSGQAPLEVRYAAFNLGLLLVNGGEVDAVFGDSRTLAVPAGGSASAELQGSTRSCGDTPAQGRVRLAAGSHATGARLRVTVDALVTPSREPTTTAAPTPTPTPTRLASEEEVSLGGTVTYG